MKKILPLFWLITIYLICLSCSYAMSDDGQPVYPSCIEGSELQLERSSELKDLARKDQEDRVNWQNLSVKEMMEVAQRDLVRRKRVGEIFGEGCFQNADNFMSAALIYQHGNSIDHFYQAFIWSRRAFELGDINGKSLSALAIDRYLIHKGKKQLFGSQYSMQFPNRCLCMQPVEVSFPDKLRKDYSGRSLEDSYKMMASVNEPGCPNTECQTSLEPTPKGSVIGLW